MTWARAIDFKLNEFPELDITHFAKKKYQKPAEVLNALSKAWFQTEQTEVMAAFAKTIWRSCIKRCQYSSVGTKSARHVVSCIQPVAPSNFVG